MNKKDWLLLRPGMRVRIADRLRGAELYGGDDPVELQEFLGKEVTVRRVETHGDHIVLIQEDLDAAFFMEEIECIVNEDTETSIEESDIPLNEFIGMKGVPVCS